MGLKYLMLMVLMFATGLAWDQFETSASEKALEKKCVHNGGQHAYKKLKKATIDFEACSTHGFQGMGRIQYLFESDNINNELDVYKNFIETCPMIKRVTECFDDEIKGLSICLNETEKEDMKNMGNVIKQTTEFICHDHAERIGLFIVEDGVECIQEKLKNIQECISKVNTSSLDVLRDAFITRKWVATRPFGDEQCDDYKKLQECIVDPMKSCKSSTPADLFESLFEEAFKGTPCDHSILSPGIIVLITVIVLAIVVLVIVVAYKVCC